MIDVETKLTGDIIEGLDKLEAKIQGSVVLSGAAAMARVIYDEVKLKAPTLGRPSFFYGQNQKYPLPADALKNAIYRVYSREASTEATKVYKVAWNHKKAPHGFMVEFGTSRAPAHPFLRPALSRMQEAISAGMDRIKERMKEIG